MHSKKPNKSETPKYQMTISRMTIDKLGVKLYDRVYAVLAEIISNSYDADATEVIVRAPMGDYLATKDQKGKIVSKNVTIEIEDNGEGMTSDELKNHYLRVGAERRKRGDTSKKFHRKVMGRKGVGKLAPFGICNCIEIISAGGDIIKRDGKEGYETVHIILDKSKIMDDSVDPYAPEIGKFDNTLSNETFTKVILKDFTYRKIGTIEELSRQLSQRFGISSKDWKIMLKDTNKSLIEPLEVGLFDCAHMPDSKISFEGPESTCACHLTESKEYYTKKADGTICKEIKAGFELNNRFYPIKGWIAYSKQPYQDELMAGVRIYCRGKYASQTVAFNHKSGFAGEYSIRSYLIGELQADWLDEEEDLIHTDRRDILWSHELGSAFQDWGQNVIKHIGTIARDPMRKTINSQFFEISKIKEKIEENFSGQKQQELRENAKKVAELLGSSLRGDELSDEKTIDDMTNLILLLAPIKTLNEKLREAEAISLSPVSVVSNILKTARLAETITFGQQIDKRLRIIKKLEQLKDSEDTKESELQNLIFDAPWLINPQWIPMTMNQSFKTWVKEFMKFYKEKNNVDIEIPNIINSKKRADFICFDQDHTFQIIEIKKPKRNFENNDLERMNRYFDTLDVFLEDPKHQDFLSTMNNYHVTLVCDGISLSGVSNTAYKGLLQKGKLTQIDWSAFFLRTTNTHKEFLEESERLKGDSENDD